MEKGISFRKIYSYLPEIVFLSFLAYILFEVVSDIIINGDWNYSTLIFPSIAFVVLGLLIKQFFRWSAFIAGVISASFLLGSVWMFLALLSEYSEFLPHDNDRYMLLIWGLPLIGVFMFLSIKMLIKAFKSQINRLLYKN